MACRCKQDKQQGAGRRLLAAAATMGGISARDESTPPAFTPRGKPPLPEHGEQYGATTGLCRAASPEGRKRGSTAYQFRTSISPREGRNFKSPGGESPAEGSSRVSTRLPSLAARNTSPNYGVEKSVTHQWAQPTKNQGSLFAPAAVGGCCSWTTRQQS
ncbi:predicted protein [Coccidioides posadasii str. Silveira]|uniref:Predicted protein n=1 Tax=Coccidioides posadasii (strain RMSCC 757 / Silveira) TaxID=443226 RepID=E9DFB5_COCPS|nr:predicted protein [Coccidioides posadasii str. Silveira]